jgi:hypothetical protein
MLNYQGGEDAGVGTRGQGSGINFRAVFTGVVDTTPLCFNPTKQDICRIKEIPADRQGKIQEPVYVNAIDRGEDGKFTRLTLLTKINPNELLCEKDEEGVVIKKMYADDVYFEVSWPISKDEELSKGGEGKTRKYRFINQSLQSTWAESLDVIRNNEKMSWFDCDTARIARKGEVLLYNLLYAWFKFASTKENPIKGFKLGEDPSETFEDIVNGDVSMLNEMLDPDEDAYKFFSHENGEVRKIAVMLGARISDKTDDNGVPYVNQSVYTNQYVNNCFAKEGRQISKDAIEAVLGEGYNAITQNSLKFQEFDPTKAEDTSTDSVVDAMSEVDSGSTDVDLSSEGMDSAFDDFA